MQRHGRASGAAEERQQSAQGMGPGVASKEQTARAAALPGQRSAGRPLADARFSTAASCRICSARRGAASRRWRSRPDVVVIGAQRAVHQAPHLL